MQYSCCLVTKLCLTLYDPMDSSSQASLFMGFPRQQYWSVLLFSQGIFLTQGPNPGLQHCRQILYCWATREAHISVSVNQLIFWQKMGIWRLQSGTKCTHFYWAYHCFDVFPMDFKTIQTHTHIHTMKNRILDIFLQIFWGKGWGDLKYIPLDMDREMTALSSLLEQFFVWFIHHTKYN